MYAYILNNEIDFVSSELLPHIDKKYFVYQYSDDYINPKFVNWTIIDEETLYQKKNRILNSILEKTPTELFNINIDFFEGVIFNESEIENIKNKYIYSNWLDNTFTELLRNMASWNFSAGQALGSEIVNRENAIKHIKNLIKAQSSVEESEESV